MTPIVVVSAQPADSAADRAIAAGAKALVEKPFEIEALLGVVRETLG